MNRWLHLGVTASVPAFLLAVRSAGAEAAVNGPLCLGAAALALGSVGVLTRQAEASPIEQGLAGFILQGVAGLLLWPLGLGRVMAAVPMTWLYASLLAVAVCPLILGREPFTAFFARLRAPEAVWKTSAFRDITWSMASGWAGLFAGVQRGVPVRARG